MEIGQLIIQCLSLEIGNSVNYYDWPLEIGHWKLVCQMFFLFPVANHSQSQWRQEYALYGMLIAKKSDCILTAGSSPHFLKVGHFTPVRWKVDKVANLQPLLYYPNIQPVGWSTSPHSRRQVMTQPWCLKFDCNIFLRRSTDASWGKHWVNDILLRALVSGT